MDQRDMDALKRLEDWQERGKRHFRLRGVCVEGANWNVGLSVHDAEGPSVTASHGGVSLADAVEDVFDELEAATPKTCECCGQVVEGGD